MRMLACCLIRLRLGELEGKFEVQLQAADPWRPQHTTILSLEHGTAYYGGQPERRDAFILAVPGAQPPFARERECGTRAMTGARSPFSAAAELDLPKGQTATVKGVSQ